MARSRRATRIKAAELVAQLACWRALSAGEIFAHIVFFELYIDHGTDYTNKMMKLLGGRGKGKLRVIAGGMLQATGDGDG